MIVRPALWLAAVSFIVTILNLLPVGVLIFFKLHDWAMLAVLLSLVTFHILNYFAVQKLLRAKKENWGFCFFCSGIESPMKGFRYFKFYLGFIWRFIFGNSLYFVFVQNVLDNPSLGFYAFVTILFTFISLFISFYWLLRFPYGKAKLKILQ